MIPTLGLNIAFLKLLLLAWGLNTRFVIVRHFNSGIGKQSGEMQEQWNSTTDSHQRNHHGRQCHSIHHTRVRTETVVQPLSAWILPSLTCRVFDCVQIYDLKVHVDWRGAEAAGRGLWHGSGVEPVQTQDIWICRVQDVLHCPESFHYCGSIDSSQNYGWEMQQFLSKPYKSKVWMELALLSLVSHQTAFCRYCWRPDQSLKDAGV